MHSCGGAVALCDLACVVCHAVGQTRRPPYRELVYLSAVGIAVAALILTFVAIWYDAQSRRVFQQVSSAPRSNGGRSKH